MAPRYRLLAKALIDGAVREPGYVFTLPEGVRGPHKTVEHGTDRVDLKPNSELQGTHIPGRVRDIPLYEEIEEGVSVSPSVERSAAVCGAETAMGGGTQKMIDEERAAREGHTRLDYLETQGDSLTGDERQERDELRKTANDRDAKANVGKHVGDGDWVGAKPPVSGETGLVPARESDAEHQPPGPKPIATAPASAPKTATPVNVPANADRPAGPLHDDFVTDDPRDTAHEGTHDHHVETKPAVDAPLDEMARSDVEHRSMAEEAMENSAEGETKPAAVRPNPDRPLERIRRAEEDGGDGHAFDHD